MAGDERTGDQEVDTGGAWDDLARSAAAGVGSTASPIAGFSPVTVDSECKRDSPASVSQSGGHTCHSATLGPPERQQHLEAEAATDVAEGRADWWTIPADSLTGVNGVGRDASGFESVWGLVGEDVGHMKCKAEEQRKLQQQGCGGVASHAVSSAACPS
eukprot:TRINITY_DN41996_c0_g1_i1.p1 TRINITY_DN41996_c0_g1~~TRINITY_DN41996_c0_g1_i1.p1  ORF type:complete len:173 (-),score=8.49 TRINITY_DN41996_c0_g1_i1:210-686(-)